MTTKIPYEIIGDEVVFADGFKYRRAARSGNPNQTYADPHEMRKILLGEGNPKAEPPPPRKVNLGEIDHRA